MRCLQLMNLRSLILLVANTSLAAGLWSGKQYSTPSLSWKCCPPTTAKRTDDSSFLFSNSRFVFRSSLPRSFQTRPDNNKHKNRCCPFPVSVVLDGVNCKHNGLCPMQQAGRAVHRPSAVHGATGNAGMRHKPSGSLDSGHSPCRKLRALRSNIWALALVASSVKLMASWRGRSRADIPT